MCEKEITICVSHLYICIVREEVLFLIKLYLKTDKIGNGRMEKFFTLSMTYRALIFI